jgi:protein SCO1
MNMPRLQTVIVAFAVIAATVGFFVGRSALPPPSNSLVLEQATLLQQPRPLPAFSLLDQRGETISEQALSGDWNLVFFGFTNCPDICPMTLQTLAALRARLAREGAQVPGVVFVSVDPQRDDPQLLGDYLAYFDADIIGITGERGAIAQLARGMGVAVIIGEARDTGDYDVDHSTAVFLVDPQGRVSALFRTPHELEGMVREFNLIVGSRG